jgi:hypothetical protein
MFLASVFLFPGPDDAILVRQIGYLPIAVLLLFAVASGALYWRRRNPAVVLAVALAAWALTLGQEYSNIGGVTLIALYATGRYASSARWARRASPPPSACSSATTSSRRCRGATPPSAAW